MWVYADKKRLAGYAGEAGCSYTCGRPKDRTKPLYSRKAAFVMCILLAFALAALSVSHFSADSKPGNKARTAAAEGFAGARPEESRQKAAGLFSRKKDKRLAEETTESPYSVERIVYKYDKAGRLSQKTKYYNGKVESTTEYSYYPDGALFEELYRGAINLYQHYDSKGTLIERDETGGIGSPAFYSSAEGDTLSTKYDAKGHITRFEVRSEDAKTPYVLTYEYDSKGRILRFCVGNYRTDSYDYRPDGSFIRTRSDTDMKLYITEYYNAEGLRTQSDRRQGDYYSTEYYEYDSRGNLIRQLDSRYGSERTWTYDAKGNPTEERINGDLSCTYRYRYDADGYMIESERRAGGTTQTTTYRYK